MITNRIHHIHVYNIQCNLCNSQTASLIRQFYTILKSNNLCFRFRIKYITARLFSTWIVELNKQKDETN